MISTLLLIAVFCGCSAPSTDTAPTTVAPTISVSAEPTEDTISSDADDNPSFYGELVENQYINKALGFTAQIPDGWVFASAETIEEITGQVMTIIEGVADMSSNTAVPLMICLQNEFDSYGPANPNINIGYSNQSSLRQLFSDAVVFEEFMGQLESMYSNMYTQFYSEVEVSTSGDQTLSINSKTYAVIRTQANLGDITMYQDQYFAQLDDGALTITASYFDDISKNIIDTFMNNINYE